ncbi:MAG TPA: Maf family protein [Pseudidiomarina sp.]|nr:Maf family protein [Pseudidiomarina sp.]
MELILASASPRRRELLQLLDRPFQVLVTQVPEQRESGESPLDYVRRLARSKASAGLQLWRQQQHSDAIVIGSDTIVVLDDIVLEKPQDEADFRRMMALLSNRSHQVLTAVAVTNGEREEVDVVAATVSFKALSPAEVNAYWQSGEPIDKAGGYGIQGRAAKFVTRVEGSYLAVVGLPLYETEQLLQAVEGTMQSGPNVTSEGT